MIRGVIIIDAGCDRHLWHLEMICKEDVEQVGVDVINNPVQMVIGYCKGKKSGDTRGWELVYSVCTRVFGMEYVAFDSEKMPYSSRLDPLTRLSLLSSLPTEFRALEYIEKKNKLQARRFVQSSNHSLWWCHHGGARLARCDFARSFK